MAEIGDPCTNTGHYGPRQYKYTCPGCHNEFVDPVEDPDQCGALLRCTEEETPTYVCEISGWPNVND